MLQNVNISIILSWHVRFRGFQKFLKIFDLGCILSDDKVEEGIGRARLKNGRREGGAAE